MYSIMYIRISQSKVSREKGPVEQENLPDRSLFSNLLPSPAGRGAGGPAQSEAKGEGDCYSPIIFTSTRFCLRPSNSP